MFYFKSKNLLLLLFFSLLVSNTLLSQNIYHFPFDEGIGIIANNTFPESELINGILSDGVLWTMNGKFNKAVSFNKSSDFINLGNSTFNIKDEFTICFWIKLNALSNNTNTFIIQRGQYAYPFGIQITGERKIQFIVRTNPFQYLISDTKLEYNIWYHVTVLFGNNVQAIYINSKLDAIVQPSGNLFFEYNSFFENTYMGKYQNSDPDFFIGTIDDLWIIDRALNENIILKIYRNKYAESQIYYTHSNNGYHYATRLNTDGTLQNWSWTGGHGLGDAGWTMADLFGDGRAVYYTHSNNGYHYATRLNADGTLQNWSWAGGHGLGDAGWEKAKLFFK